MMSILTRLRKCADDPTQEEAETFREAADEIERLRVALKKIDAVKFYGPEGAEMECNDMHEIARSALQHGVE